MTEPVQRGLRARIQRIQNRYIYIGEPSRAGEVRARLDGLVERHLPSACAQSLPTVLREDDPSVWFIRRLPIHLLVSEEGVSHDLPKHLGDAIAAGVERVLRTGADGRNVVYFRDRAAYLARFVADLLNGRAEQQWFYEEALEGLRALPAAVAASEALLRDPARIGEVLASLRDTAELDEVVRSLGEVQSRRLIEAAPRSSATLRRAVSELVGSVKRSPILHDLGTHQNALRILAGSAGDGSAWDQISAVGSVLLVSWLDLLRSAPHPASLLEDVAAGHVGSIVNWAGSGSLDAVTRWVDLTNGDLAWLESVTRDAGARVDASTDAKQQHETWFSELAGAVLPWRVFMELGVDDVLASAGPRRGLLRWLILSRLVGMPRRRVAQLDPLLRLLAGMDDSKEQDVNELVGDEGVADRFIERLIENGRVAADRVCARRVEHRDGPFVVLRDEESGIWLDIVHESDALHVPEPADRIDQADAEYFIGFESDVDPSVAIVGARLAQPVMRLFAARCPGFSSGSAAYLYHNLIAGGGHITRGDGSLHVALFPRPLQIVLQMCGIDGASTVLPWAPDTTLTLSLSKG